MPTILKFEDIEAWQTARELTRMVYELSRHGEFARDFGLSDQMQPSDCSFYSIFGATAKGNTRRRDRL